MKNTKIIALDTNIFIYYFEGNEVFGRKAKLIFDRLTANKLKAAASVIALAELLSSPKLNQKAVKETRNLFLSVPNLEIYHVNENIAAEAAGIRREYGFRLLDAVQLATARLARAQFFLSNDEKLKKFKPLRVKLISEL